MIQRQPFPGPGLAIRVLGEVTEERLKVLREADVIVLDEIKAAGFYEKVWQSFAVLLPIKTVGVMGDERSYENVIALRVVDSQDGMTANWVPLPFESARQNFQPDLERSARYQPRRLRYLFQAAGDHRVGIVLPRFICRIEFIVPAYRMRKDHWR